ncbi:MAG: sulfurtransferase [Actinomycetia bacterium]|nr:sulfurtransferase [Actinomycetes bacterium]MCP5031919.1 sulfurtransferase [Actinomycetes bacterium]
MDSLVSAAWLGDYLDDPDLRILECTVELKPAPGGYEIQEQSAVWAEGHIPSSAYVDLANDLSDQTSALRFTMPSSEQFAAAMEAVGVGEGTRVVLYDRRMTMWATRVFWMLKAFGFDQCAVLDGGWKNWTGQGRPTTTDPTPIRSQARFAAKPRPQMIASLDRIEAAVGDAGTCIVNSLSPQNHDGTDDGYGRPGHIPGASNVYAVALLDQETHLYRPVDELAALFDHVPANKPVITYCGGGIAATSDAFVLTELLGRTDVAVYDGSLSEWLQDPDRPLVTSD